MTFTRQSAAAALLAACFASTCANVAFASGEADAPRAEDRGPGRGPAEGPHDGPRGGHHPGFGGHGPGAPGPEMPFAHLHGLNLSEAQQDKLFALMHAQAPQHREQEKAIRKAHEALRELARTDRFDDARAGALSRELGQAVAAEALLRARTEAQALAILTPEQRQQLRERQQSRERRGPQDGAQGRP